MTPLSLLLVLIIGIGTSGGSVIIVGAGAAGIAAASKLLENNVADVKILEAGKRIGGRIQSIKFGQTFVDLGAEWCYGQEENSVYDLVKDLDLLRHTELYTLRFQYSTREKVDDILNAQLWRIILETCTFECNRGDKEGVTLEDYCTEKYHLAVSDLHLDDPEKLNFAKDVLDYFKAFMLATVQSFTWTTPSALCDFKLLAGDPALNWGPFGFKTVLDVLIKKASAPLPVLFNKEVSQILWDEKSSDGAVVRCTDGSEYIADQVIFTPSLGVLKEKHETMFLPKLPADKKAAIETLGYDAIFKMALRFQDDWWREEELIEEFTGFNLVWSSLQNYPELLNEKNMTWVYDCLGFFPPPNASDVLIAWFVGPYVPEIEKLSDEVLLEGIHFILDVFLGDFFNVTAPYDFVRSWWYTDPHFKGTVSFQTMASRKVKSNEDLARPLRNSKGDLALLFAGEATHPLYYASAHGAIDTGYREAERLLTRPV